MKRLLMGPPGQRGGGWVGGAESPRLPPSRWRWVKAPVESLMRMPLLCAGVRSGSARGRTPSRGAELGAESARQRRAEETRGAEEKLRLEGFISPSLHGDTGTRRTVRVPSHRLTPSQVRFRALAHNGKFNPTYFD
ncbi:unnamed protein product [Boreogadus saida]